MLEACGISYFQSFIYDHVRMEQGVLPDSPPATVQFSDGQQGFHRTTGG